MVEPRGGGREGILPGSPRVYPQSQAAQLQLKGGGAGPPGSGTELGGIPGFGTVDGLKERGWGAGKPHSRAKLVVSARNRRRAQPKYLGEGWGRRGGEHTFFLEAEFEGK